MTQTPVPCPVPVTIIAGFLGAGKTTLVNRLLAGAHGKKITVMVNDFGAINIDADLIIKRNQQIMELSNGCVCCSLQGDLVVQLQQLFHSGAEMDHLLIEASGVSQPGRIASVFGYPTLRTSARLDAVVTLVDAANVGALPAASSGLVRTQIEAADLVLLTKADLVDQQKVRALREEWLFPDLPMIEVVNGDVPFDVLLGFHRTKADIAAPQTENHTDTFNAVTWSSKHPISLSDFRATMAEHSCHLYRAKGILYCSDHPEARVLYQRVGSRETFELAGPWVGEKISQIAAIGEGHDATESDLCAALDLCIVQA